MHELTKQLARQAELLQFVNGMTCYRQQHKLEKFARLIVKECVGIADEYDGVGSTIVSRIEKHFGVE